MHKPVGALAEKNSDTDVRNNKMSYCIRVHFMKTQPTTGYHKMTYSYRH